MLTRRDFLKAASLAGGATLLDHRLVWGRSPAMDSIVLNDFIETHSNAVFILRTNVDVKTNTQAIKAVGRQLADTLFVRRPTRPEGLSITGEVVIKPNITAWAWDIPPIETTMGIQTDPYFVEGVINSFQNLGVASSNIYIREANYASQRPDGTWYTTLAQRTGINLRELPSIGSLNEADVQWMDVPNGVWYSRIPFLWPVNAPGSCLVNIAKFKSHSMGMTLCSKNLQGTNARPYVQHCTRLSASYGVNPNHIVPNARTAIQANYQRHRDAGIPRWDLPGESTGGLWQETHASRCIDNNSVTVPLINIVEGVYGREGPFVSGPPDNGGYGRDIMTNIVIFGKRACNVDIVGTYLAGHEPGNFGFFHLALERGISQYLNPRGIPLYEWHPDGSATLTSLDNFPRAAIRTLYLQRPTEERYHMVNERFSYTGIHDRGSRGQQQPDLFVLSQNFPNPFNPSTSMQFRIPESGDVRLEVFDAAGQLIDVLLDKHLPAGDHLHVWRASRCASGSYFCRLSFNGMHRTRPMVLLR